MFFRLNGRADRRAWRAPLFIGILLALTACGGDPECRLNADCDDSDACTTDMCIEGTCAIVPMQCDDGAFCNGTETCDPAIGCQPGQEVELDDGLDCTIDYCDDMLDQVFHDPNDQRCNDDLFCNGTEVCDPAAGCVVGVPTEIDDGVACTNDVCDESLELIVHYPIDSLCDDGQYCNGVETCDPTLDCLAGTPPAIDDGVPCTDDSCDDVLDVVVNAPNDGFCDDGLFCNGAEVCDPALDCQAGVSPVDDGISCTGDACDEVNDTVTHTPDDAVCDDGYDCTVDSCDLGADCQNVSNGTCDCSSVLLYTDCTSPLCTAEPDASAADEAALALGFTVTETTDDTGDFETQLATGNHNLVVVESNLNCLPSTMIDALTTYVQGGGRLIFAHWDLDGNSTCPDLGALRTAMGVITGPDITTARPVYNDPLSPVDLFDSLRTFNDPLIITDLLPDDGDELTVADGADFLAARFDGGAGPGAIAVTRSRQVVVNGFDPFGLLINAPVDSDGDGVRDLEELYINEMGLICLQ